MSQKDIEIRECLLLLQENVKNPLVGALLKVLDFNIEKYREANDTAVVDEVRSNQGVIMFLRDLKRTITDGELAKMMRVTMNQRK